MPLGLVRSIGEVRSYMAAKEAMEQPGSTEATVPDNEWTALAGDVMAERMRRARAGDPREA